MLQAQSITASDTEPPPHVSEADPAAAALVHGCVYVLQQALLQAAKGCVCVLIKSVSGV